MIKILAIDDKKDNLISLEAIIKSMLPDTTFISATTGKIGIELAIKDEPDVIILDIVMPIMDGFEVCRIMKTTEKLQDIPIVFITAAKGDRDSRIKALEVGAEAFITKPINKTELVAQIRAMTKINAANKYKRNEKERLAKLVDERTKELQNSNEALLSNEKRMQDIFKSMNEGFSIQDVICDEKGNPIDLRFVEANPAFEKQTGLINSETLGHTLLELFPSSEKYWIERYGKVGKTGEPITFEAMFGPLNIYYHVNAFQTAPRQFGVLFTDINDRKLHEIELTKAKERAEESEKNLLLGQQIAQMGFWKLNPENRKISGSEELFRIFELKKDNLSVDFYLNSIHPVDKGFALDHLDNAIKKGIPWDFELRLLFEDGRVKWLHTVGEPQIDDDKKVSAVIGIVQDITERKQAAKDLLESETRFRRLTENAEDMIYRMSIPSGIYEFINPACEKIFGYSQKEFYENPKIIEKVIHPEWTEYFAEQWENLLKGIVPTTYEYEIIHKSGEKRWINQRNVPIKNDENKPIALEGIVTDITAQKQVEKKLRESEEKLRLTIDSSPLGVGICDIQGNFISTNQSYIKMVGYSKEELIKMSIFDVTHPDDQPENNNLFENMFSKQNAEFTMEKRYIRKNGSTINVLVHSGAINDTQGKPMLGLAFVEDITKRKEEEKALIQSEEKFRTFSQISPVGIFVTDVEGKTNYWNDKLDEITGMPIEEGKGAGWVESIHPDDREMVFKEWYKSTESRSKFDLKYRFKNKYGKITWVIGQAVPMQDTSGELIGFVGSIVDITDIKHAEEKVKSQLNELQRWHDVMINREEKTLELKHEVNELLKQIGKPIRYSSIDKEPIKKKNQNN